MRDEYPETRPERSPRCRILQQRGADSLPLRGWRDGEPIDEGALEYEHSDGLAVRLVERRLSRLLVAGLAAALQSMTPRSPVFVPVGGGSARAAWGSNGDQGLGPGCRPAPDADPDTDSSDR